MVVPIFVLALIWLVVAVLALAVPSEFRVADYIVIGGLALAGIWYVVGLRARLRNGTAGRPVLELKEKGR